jgi:hypothetical protein
VVAKVRRGGHEVRCRNEDDGGLIKEGWGGRWNRRAKTVKKVGSIDLFDLWWR